MKIQKSAEDYLEAMLIMKEEHGYIRSIDLAEHLGVTKPSVSYAVKQLRENGYITMDGSNKIYSRHKMLKEFFIRLGVDEKIALEDACKIEHDISDETFDAMCKHLEEYS